MCEFVNQHDITLFASFCTMLSQLHCNQCFKIVPIIIQALKKWTSFFVYYLQQSLAPQLAEANRQYDISGVNAKGGATQAGAFGGSRYGIEQGVQNQANQLAMSNLVGQGYNQAYNTANQNMQQAAQLGMQGAGMGLQGVSGAQQGYSGATQAGAALGNIGAQQAAAQLGILGLQNQLGTQQYNMPYQAAQFQQGLLTGLPISTTTSQGYTAPPSLGSQALGLGTTVLGGYLAGKAAGAWNKGGQIKSYAKGGKVGTDLADIRLHKLVG